MKFGINNRMTGNVQFTAEIECDKNAPLSIKIGLAVRWAINTGANLAGAYLARANLAGANLAGAYLAGAYLARANLAGAYLTGAYLAGAYLARANLADANLAGAYLAGAYLAGANLAGANLAGANLAGAYLADANLAGAYPRGRQPRGRPAKIDPAEIPVIPNIDATILAAIESGGTLDMSSWHGPHDQWCGTTHCRAGWAVHLAGEKGKSLQDRVGAQMAGTLIYHASRPGIPAPYFFASDDDALTDIKRCAASRFEEEQDGGP